MKKEIKKELAGCADFSSCFAESNSRYAKMKNYLKYEFKKSLLPITVFTIIACGLYGVSLLSSNFIYYHNGNGGVSAAYPQVGMLVTMLAILACIVPILQYSFKSNRRSVDVMYSMPITRRNIYIAKTVTGLCQMLIPFIVAYWMGFVIVCCSENVFDLIWYLPMFFALIGVAIALYGTNAFIFTRANTSSDGVIFVGLWSCVLAIIAAYFFRFAEYQNVTFMNKIDASFFFTFTPMTYVTGVFESLIMNDVYQPIPNIWIILTFFMLAGAAGFFGLIYTVKNEKAENAGQISSSLWGYKTLIPVFSAFLLGVFGDIQDIWIYLVIIGALTFVGMIVYRRSFKIKISDWITFGSALIAGVILCGILDVFVNQIVS